LLPVRCEEIEMQGEGRWKRRVSSNFKVREIPSAKFAPSSPH
jgi:hypothetical protein